MICYDCFTYTVCYVHRCPAQPTTCVNDLEPGYDDKLFHARLNAMHSDGHIFDLSPPGWLENYSRTGILAGYRVR